MGKQAVILGFAACVLIISAWFFDADVGVILIAAGGLFGWMVRHISGRTGAARVSPGAAAMPEAESQDGGKAAHARGQNLLAAP